MWAISSESSASPCAAHFRIGRTVLTHHPKPPTHDPSPRARMNFLTRALLAAAVLAVALQSSLVSAQQPKPLEERRADMRARMLQARLARLAVYDKKEYDFYHRNDNKGKRA